MYTSTYYAFWASCFNFYYLNVNILVALVYFEEIFSSTLYGLKLFDEQKALWSYL